MSGKHLKNHLLSSGFLTKDTHTSVSEADLIGYHLFESDCVKHCTSLICKSILLAAKVMCASAGSREVVKHYL